MNIFPKPLKYALLQGNLIVLPLLLCILPAVTLNAQTNEITFEQISIEQGLSQTTVYCIFQDSRGFMWFGTRDGLNKYDGYGFTVYKHVPEDSQSLSHSSVRAIFEDRSGTLWIGTEGGLNAYSREKDTFTRFVMDPDDPQSLSHNRIRTLLEDRLGTLWVGTNGGGLNKLVPGDTPDAPPTFVRYRNDPSNPASLSHDKVYTMIEVSTEPGGLWIGTIGGGLNKFDRETGAFTRYQHDPNNPASLSDNTVNAIYEDQVGILWVGTRKGGLDRLVLPGPGISKHDPAATFVHYRHDPANPRSLSHNNVNVLYQDRTGDFWVGTYGDGLDQVITGEQEGARLSFTHHRHDTANPNSLSHNLIRSIYEDRSGVLWVGTSEGGVNKIDRTKRKFAHYKHDPDNPQYLSANSVSSLYEDSSGRLWVGTYGGGLNQEILHDNGESSSIFIHHRQDLNDLGSLSNDVVSSIFADQSGVLWVGTLGGGLNALNLPTLASPNYSVPPSFIRYKHDSHNPHSLSNDRVESLYEDPDEPGVLWIGTFGGLNKLDRTTGLFTRYQYDPNDPATLSHDHINILYEDQAGGLWIGTRGGGLNRFDRETGRFTRYSHDPNNPYSLSHNHVNAIIESRDMPGELWIGTQNGLNKMEYSTSTYPEEQMRFVHYGTREGLQNDAILGILEDHQGALWLSTYRGLSRFNRHTETFRNFDVHDGLQSNEFNVGAYYKGNKGTLFFGGINGFNAFDPKTIKDDPHAPQLVFTDFQLFNESVPIGNDLSAKHPPVGRRSAYMLERNITEITDLVLSYQESVFSFEFAALHYSLPEKNQYAYKMEGFDEDWVQVGTRRFATYTNLDPGDYVFRVKGANRDGVWNEEGIATTLTIVPPYWKTWWFRFIIGASLLALVFGWYRQRIRNIETQKNNLEVQVVERTRDLEKALHLLTDTQDQLIHTEKMASLGQLTAGIAHEIKNPLNFVNNFAYLSVDLADEIHEKFDNLKPRLSGESLADINELLTDLKHNAKWIAEHGERADGIIRSMLDHARIQRGERCSIDVNELLERYLSLAYHSLQTQQPAFNVTLKRNYDETLCPVDLVPQEMSRVFINLLNNAFEAVCEKALTENNETYVPRVAVQTLQEAGYVEIRVCDNGFGVPEKIHNKIFEPFFTTKPPGSGTGLGLSLAHEIVVQGHGGTLSVESTDEQGATFVIMLPVKHG